MDARPSLVTIRKRSVPRGLADRPPSDDRLDVEITARDGLVRPWGDRQHRLAAPRFAATSGTPRTIVDRPL